MIHRVESYDINFDSLLRETLEKNEAIESLTTQSEV